jgi:transposase
MVLEHTSVGLDVHARSVVAGVLDTGTGELWSRRLPPATEAVVAWITSLAGPVVVAYEAGPTGFGLARALEQVGVRWVVVAPSKLERPPGGSGQDRPARRRTAGPAVADRGAAGRARASRG